MIIATYNVWNSESGMPQRSKYIHNELQKVGADIVCLQEVQNLSMAQEIAHTTGYKYSYFEHYDDYEEGLCILSKIHFEKCECWLKDSNAIYASFLWNGKKVVIINLHLSCDSVKIREQQIMNIICSLDKMEYDYVFMAGDFNCYETSDIHRFLMGDCLLQNHESMPCWFDLAAAYAELSNQQLESTLNFRKNPRFINNTIELNARFDRILLRNTYPNEFPTLVRCEVFGQTIYKDTNLSASDHYGVVVEIK